MGSTVTHFVVVKLPQDHPHIHGEHLAISVVVINPGGSPPYTWGALQAPYGSIVALEDHPHIHGEHLIHTHNLFA